MISVKVANLDKFKRLQAPQGCLIEPEVNHAKHGLAYDSILEDYIFSFLHDISVQVIADYLVALLLLQKDDGGIRTIVIEKTEININAVSTEEVEKIIYKIIEEKKESISKENSDKS